MTKHPFSMWKFLRKFPFKYIFLVSSQGHRTLSTMISSRKKLIWWRCHEKRARNFFISLLNENIWLPCQMRFEAEFLALQKLCWNFIVSRLSEPSRNVKSVLVKIRRENCAVCQWNFPKRRKLKMRKLRTFKGYSFCLSFSLFLSIFNGARTG